MHSSRKRKQKEQATREEEQEASNGLNGGDGGAAHAREEHEDEEPQRQRRRRDAGSAAATSQQQHQHQQQQREGPSSTTGVAGTGLGGRTPIPPSDDEEEEDDDEQGGSGEGVDGDGGSEDPQQQPGGECSEDPAQQDGDGPAAKKKPHKKVLSEQKLRRLKEEYNRRGVVYISRIPPHMKPMKLKQMLSAYGETLRVYCTPEDPTARRLRKQKGGNTGKNFTEGWVEFADKRVAKRVALAINGKIMGGKKRSAYHDDLWCIKYLKHFKWDHLTEEIAYQKAVREQRLAAELSTAKRERDHYLAQVDRAKAVAAMAERRAAKAQQQQQPGADGAAEGKAEGKAPRVNRDLGQRLPKPDPALAAKGAGTGAAGGAAQPRELPDDLLMMIARTKRKREGGDDA